MKKNPGIPNQLSTKTKDLLKGLLNKNPEERIGYKNHFEEVKSHPFFEGIKWD